MSETNGSHRGIFSMRSTVATPPSLLPRGRTKTARYIAGFLAALMAVVAMALGSAADTELAEAQTDPSTDRVALVALYNATDGPNWSNKTNWLSAEPIGEWHGVTTDGSGRVTALDLDENELNGKMPAELGSLSNLQRLYLNDNSGLSGPLPGSSTGLTSLTYLDLSGTGVCAPTDASFQAWLENIATRLGVVNCREQTTGDPLIDRYDANNNGTIERSEVLAAITDHLFGGADETISRAEVLRLITLHLFGPPTATPTPEPTPTPTATPPPIVITGPQIYNNNVFVLPVAEDLARGWFDSPLREHTARFYEYFNDEFDFLVFVSNVTANQLEPGTPHGAYYVGVENDVKGIGQTTYAQGREWGSTEKLQGVIYINTYDYSWGGDFVGGVLLHELMHRWANFVVPPHPHWGFINDHCILDGYNISTMIDLGGGRYSHEFSPNPYVYCPIELYLAGLIPPEDVPDFRVAVDGEWVWDEEGNIIEDDNGYRVFTASGFETYTVDDIIAEHGPRVPDTSKAQKDFRAAVVLLVGTDYSATPAILDRLSYDVSWQSHPGDRDHMLLQGAGNFYHATGGRARITMDGLSDFLRDSE